MDDLHLLIGRIDGKLDSLIESHTEYKEAARVQDKRISALESHKDKALGAWAAVSVIGGVVGAFIHKIFP